MPVGYMNPGGDESKIEPVEALTEEEAALQRAAGQMYLRIESGNKAARELDELKKRCRHRVFRDTPGWAYYDRTCVVCGADLGFV